MRSNEIIIKVNEDGTAILTDGGITVDGKLLSELSEAAHYQSYANAFELGKIRAEKFIAECKMERGITAKKEIDDAQGSPRLAEGGKDETPEPV